MTPRTEAPRATHWWRDAVGYEVYLRSFADGDGDGIGDLWGLHAQLPHLDRLGIDVVWITPCYPSPGFDHGYDVADYLDIAEVFGGMVALRAVLDEAHARGMRVVLDLVPNHSSSQHPWFRSAVADRDSPYRDFYVWRDGTPDRPPTNWMSHFGGPAWTWEPTTGQWYLHRFLPEQPDLNWRNPAVADAFDRILTTWFERGVDGFRIDVAQGLLVDGDFRDNPEPATPPDWRNPRAAYGSIDHVYDLDQPDNVEVFRRWATRAAEHDALLLGEVYLPAAERVARYVEEGVLHRAFYFPGLHTGWDHAQIRATLADGLRHGRGRFSWVMSSHDDPRASTRFGGGELGATRQLAYLALLLVLPGTPFLYQGDELGLEDGVLPPGEAEDPIATRNHGAVGRDGSRTPMPWSDGPSLGFTTGTPWLPVGTNHGVQHTVAAQRDQPGSCLDRTTSLLQRRRALRGMLDTDEVVWLDVEAPVLALRRGDVVVATNVGGAPTRVPVPAGGELVVATTDGASIDGSALHLPTDTSAWVRVAP